VEVQLLGNTYTVSRLRLREWLILNSKQVKITEALERHDTDAWCSAVCACLSFALNVPELDVQTAPWYEVVYALNAVNRVNTVGINLPFLIASPKSQPLLDYENRSWYQVAHMLAKEYGWSLEEIAQIDIKDAAALIQEILVDEQLEREWQYSLSEVAYSYDPHTKKSVYKPLKRPSWMYAGVVQKPLPKYKIPRDLLPPGIVIAYEPDTPLTH